MSEQEPTIAEVRAQLREAKEMMDLFRRAIAPLQEKQQGLQGIKDAAYQEYLKKCDEVDKEKTRIDRELSDVRRQMEAMRVTYERADSMLEQMISLEKAEDNLKVLEDRWNALTKDAPWRKFIMEHQQSGSDKMVFHRKVGNFDVMGLGKTFQAIVATDKVKAATAEGDTWYDVKVDSIGRVIGTIPHNGPPAGRYILYLSPAELVRNVEPEWKKWAPYRQPKVLSKRTKLQREVYLEAIEEMKEMGSDILVLLNYESWRKDTKFLDRLISIGFDTVILDEAHVLKDRGSNAYRGVSRILSGHSNDGFKIADPVRFVWPMTGTPFLNRPQELYSILTLLEPKIFPNATYGENNFLYNYCKQMEDENGRKIPNKWTFRPGGLERLAKVIGNRYIRRTLDQAGIVLPPQEVTYHDLDIDEDRYPAQAKAREEMRKAARLILSDEHAVVATIELTVRLRLRQIETWPAGIKLKNGDGTIAAEVDVYESQKMDYVINNDGEGLLTEVCPDQRTVVFSQFKEPLRIIAERAKKEGIKAIVLDGDTPENIRDEIKIDFDRHRCYENGREKKWDLLLANYKVGGVGLNLTDITQAIMLDEEWNPGKEDQASGRLRRIGQTENTAVHIIRMSNTVDSWMAGLIAQKKDMTEGFIVAMDRQAMLDALEKGEM